MKQWKGNKGLAGGAPCSWYIDENIVDIKIFQRSPLHRPWYSWYIDENIVDIKIFQRSPLHRPWYRMFFLYRHRNQSSAAASPYQESPLAKNGGTLVVTDVIKWLERPCHPMQNCIRYLL